MQRERRLGDGNMQRILVTGALGQIGSELVPALRERYGPEQVIASDLAQSDDGGEDLYQRLDCLDAAAIRETLRRHNVGVVYHLAALLSAVAEQKPQAAWNVNIGGLFNMLEAGREFHFQLFAPSSIAAFGPSSPRDQTPQVTVQRPTSMYGVTKAAGELLCDYYALRFGVDARGLRLPGLVSHVAPPGGGTTDYAVEMFHAAAQQRRYVCFLRADTRLDFMYMPDAIAAMIQLMEADAGRLKHRNAYNVTAMSVTPAELAAEIKKFIPEFSVDYRIDPMRQAIADSWPRSLNAQAAREDWRFSASFDLSAMTADMLDKLDRRAGRQTGEAHDAHSRIG